MAARKRSYRRKSYRRTFKRKTFKRRRNAVQTLTTDKGTGSGIQFRSRKMSRRAYNRALYRKTTFETHYRSVSLNGVTGSTGAVQGVSTPAKFRLLFSSGGAAFYTSGGGARAVDLGGSVPTFDGRIFLRGGQIKICAAIRGVAGDVTNPTAAADVVLARLWIVFSTPNPLNYTLAAETFSWDPSVEADFQQYGKVKYYKEALLSDGGGKSMQINWRLMPQNIDQQVFITGQGGSQLHLFYQFINMTSNSDVAVDLLTAYNLSFCGDAES